MSSKPKKKIQKRKERVKPKIDVTNEELIKIKVLCDYVFADQYKDSASFPRFEECFGILVKDLNISLQQVFMDMCGPKRKYITFRRMIKAYLNYKNKNRRNSEDFNKFMDCIYNEALKDDEANVLLCLSKFKPSVLYERPFRASIPTNFFKGQNKDIAMTAFPVPEPKS